MANRSRNRQKVILGEIGRIILPASVRKDLGLKQGDALHLSVDDGMIQLKTVTRSIKDIQTLVRSHNPNRTSLVDKLFTEREREAAKDGGESTAIAGKRPN